MTHTPTSLGSLRDAGLSYRDALIAAAILPHLPDGEVLVRLRTGDDGFPHRTEEHRIDEFEARVPTIGGSENLRRCAFERPSNVSEDTALHECPSLDFEPRPHGIKDYRIDLDDADVFKTASGDYDFDDTDQSFLSDWGAGSTAFDAVGSSIRPYQYPRRPTCPTYTG